MRDERGLFELLCLEGFQSGLSWRTILARREAFRRAFAGFEPESVAAFGPAEVARLLADPEIIRHRGKIEATIANARAALALRGTGTTLPELVWSFRPDDRPAPRTRSEVPSRTPASAALARELRRRGFRFVGATTMYALLQAAGLVDDHLADCPARAAIEAERARDRAG